MKKWHGVKHISVPDKYDRSCESGVQKSERERGIKMISEGSCDTEDWSNDADNSALPSQEYIIFYNIKNKKNSLKSYTFL